jgi:hypothetical protein
MKKLKPINKKTILKKGFNKFILKNQKIAAEIFG